MSKCLHGLELPMYIYGIPRGTHAISSNTYLHGLEELESLCLQLRLVNVVEERGHVGNLVRVDPDVRRSTNKETGHARARRGGETCFLSMHVSKNDDKKRETKKPIHRWLGGGDRPHQHAIFGPSPPRFRIERVRHKNGNFIRATLQTPVGRGSVDE